MTKTGNKTIQIPSGLHTEFAVTARYSGLTIQDAAEEAIKDWIEKKKGERTETNDRKDTTGLNSGMQISTESAKW